MSRRHLVALPLLLAVLAVGLVLLARPSGGPDAPGQTAAGPTPTPVAQAGGTGAAADPAPVAPAQPEEELTGVDVARILVPSLGIDAPIITLGIDADGTMQSPSTPTDVAWYSFSGKPGERSNVVMAGHLDFRNYGPAVFYDLRTARVGAEVELVLVDGSTARYAVLDVTTYDEATAPVQDIVGPTDTEIVTLITCGGSFDPLSREYDKRIVLRAERIQDTAQAN